MNDRAQGGPSREVPHRSYLGTLERSITLNFSKGASNIIAQVGGRGADVCGCACQ